MHFSCQTCSHPSGIYRSQQSSGQSLDLSFGKLESRFGIGQYLKDSKVVDGEGAEHTKEAKAVSKEQRV